MRPLATWCCNSRVESNMYSISLSALAKYVKYPKDIGFLFSEGHFSLSLYIYKKLLYKTTYICSWVLTFKKNGDFSKLAMRLFPSIFILFWQLPTPASRNWKKKFLSHHQRHLNSICLFSFSFTDSCVTWGQKTSSLINNVLGTLLDTLQLFHKYLLN